MEFTVHKVLLITILYTTTNLTRAQNLDSIQIALNIPSSSESYYGSENEVISSKFENDSQPYISGMAIRVVEFSSGVYKIGKIFA